MARRSVLLMVAVLIALIGTALIVVYVQGIDARATEGQELVEVLVATEALEAGESVSAAQEAGKFEKKEVRRDDVVDGRPRLDQLDLRPRRYWRRSTPASSSSPRSSARSATPTALVIPDDKMAISVELTDCGARRGLRQPRATRSPSSSRPSTRSGSLPDGDESKLGDWTRIVLPRGPGRRCRHDQRHVADHHRPTTASRSTEEVPRTILTIAVDPGARRRSSSTPTAPPS